jgi:hypothetical protein
MIWCFESHRLKRSSEVGCLIVCVVNCSSVSVVTRLRAGECWIDSRQGQEISSTASVLVVCVTVYGWVKLLDLEAERSRPSRVEVKNLCIMTNVMHKFLINLSIYFCLACFGLSISPSSEAGVQIRQWF